jgi:dTDP-glucose 4,6-dehydratase|uniref:UDP-glucuronate decarboxylase n=1 Tax=candidate division WOR-3 bacterium TaxID=2052148 RepID=A0A7C3UWM7_UNCW3
MKILLTGGAGFIGSHLAEALLAEGNEVICVDNLITGRMANIAHLLNQKNFRFYEWDVSEGIQSLGLERVDAIFHFASPASPKDYFRYPIETMRVGSFATYHLLELARKNNSLFFFASTSEVYGDPLSHPQKEEYWGNVNPVGKRAVYDEAKRFSEAMVMTYHRQYQIPIRIARIFNTYGPRMRIDDGRVVPNLITQALKGEPLTIYGEGKQTRSFCFITDMIEGLLRLFRTEIFQPINLGNPEEFTILEFAHLVLKLTGRNNPIVHLPLLPDDPERRKPDITKAKNLLGWEPKVKLPEGLERTIEWFKKELGL